MLYLQVDSWVCTVRYKNSCEHVVMVPRQLQECTEKNLGGGRGLIYSSEQRWECTTAAPSDSSLDRGLLNNLTQLVEPLGIQPDVCACRNQCVHGLMVKFKHFIPWSNCFIDLILTA